VLGRLADGWGHRFVSWVWRPAVLRNGEACGTGIHRAVPTGGADVVLLPPLGGQCDHGILRYMDLEPTPARMTDGKSTRTRNIVVLAVVCLSLSVAGCATVAVSPDQKTIAFLQVKPGGGPDHFGRLVTAPVADPDRIRIVATARQRPSHPRFHPAGDCLYDTALHDAARNGDKEAALSLLAKGAIVDARGEKGRTPLIVAVYHGNVEMVALLLERGADTSLCDHRTSSPHRW